MDSRARSIRASRLATLGVVVLLFAACGQRTASPTPNASPVPAPTSSAVPSPVTSPSPSASPSAPTGWQPAAPMVHPRIDFHAVLLTDGSLLAVGDDECGIAGAYEGSVRAEIYDHATDRWTEVGSLNKPRGGPQLVALPDGRAMVLGGVNERDEGFSSTKIYTPDERAWTPGPLMIRAGIYTAAALADGTVISVGIGGTEILDPGATAWRRSTPPGKVFLERLFPLPDGHVLGVGDKDNEERDPAFVTFDLEREVWTSIAAASSSRDDIFPFEDGSILVLGSGDAGTGVERYDPAADRWVAVAPMGTGRYGAQATVLSDGRVLVAGGMVHNTGASDDEVTDTTEIYDPASDTWMPGPRLLTPRVRGHATTLPDGSVLVYGGHGQWSSPPSPDTGSTECPPPLAESERLYAVP